MLARLSVRKNVDGNSLLTTLFDCGNKSQSTALVMFGCGRRLNRIMKLLCYHCSEPSAISSLVLLFVIALQVDLLLAGRFIQCTHSPLFCGWASVPLNDWWVSFKLWPCFCSRYLNSPSSHFLSTLPPFTRNKCTKLTTMRRFLLESLDTKTEGTLRMIVCSFLPLFVLMFKRRWTLGSIFLSKLSGPS